MPVIHRRFLIGKPSSPEQQKALECFVKLGERVIDAYARAVALCTKPEQERDRRKLMTRLTSVYKSFHNNSDAGLDVLIGSVLAKPLPE